MRFTCSRCWERNCKCGQREVERQRILAQEGLPSYWYPGLKTEDWPKMQLEEQRKALDLRRRAMKSNKARRWRMAQAEAQRRLGIGTVGPFTYPTVAELATKIAEEWERGNA